MARKLPASMLALLVLACIVPASLMAVALIWYDYQLSRESFVHSAMATARANALEIDKELAVVESALIALSTSPSFTPRDLKAFDAQARKLGARQNIFNIVLEDASGQQLMNTFLPYGQPLPRNPDDLMLKRILERDETVNSSLFIGPVSARHIVSVGIPLRDGEGKRYVLTATIAAERFEAVLRQQSYPAHWITSVLDRNGLIVARSKEMKRFMGTSAIPQVMQRLRRQHEGAFETETLDGVPILAVMSRAGKSEWTVAIGIPLDRLTVVAAAAIAAKKSGRPVKLRADRDDDMLVTGKRHCFYYEYEVGYGDDGKIIAAKVDMVSRAGYSADLSGPVATRAVCHFDNTYYLSDVDIRAACGKTNTQSNTAFRGFGGPQGAIAIEYIIDEIARELGQDAYDIRRLNFYGKDERNVTPYGQVIVDNVIAELTAELEQSSEYRARREAIAAYNATSPLLKKGLALTPLKFGIAFNVTHLNQAGALVHVYVDGSVLVNHGGTEMGQGINTKVI
eukprot:gene27769-34538_t